MYFREHRIESYSIWRGGLSPIRLEPWPGEQPRRRGIVQARIIDRGPTDVNRAARRIIDKLKALQKTGMKKKGCIRVKVGVL